MVKELSLILRDKLADLPFIDLLAGMTQTLTKNNHDRDSGKLTSTDRFPVSDNVLGTYCQGKEEYITPDASYKSIIYFEDNGTTIGSRRRRQHNQYISNVRVVCWMNRARLVGDNYAQVSAIAIMSIKNRLTFVNQNQGLFSTLSSRVTRILPMDAGVFSRYTYKEQHKQYLRPPFEFFAMDLQCTYYLPEYCIPEINWDNPKCI